MLYDIVSNKSKYVMTATTHVNVAHRHAIKYKLSTLVLVDETGTYIGCVKVNHLEKVANTSTPICEFADDSFETVDKEHIGTTVRGLTPVLDGKKLHSIVILPTQAQLKRACDKIETVAIVGMGFVGATLAIALAESGLKVIGVEKDKTVRNTLISGNLHFYEPDGNARLHSVLRDQRLRIFSPNDPVSADAFVITVGTPLNSKVDKTPNKKQLNQAFKHVVENCNGDEVVILRSTVPIGTCDSIIASNTDLFVTKDETTNLTLAMAPERTIEGRALEELFVNPQIIGTHSAMASAKAAKIFSHLGVKNIQLGSSKEAELAKLIDNTYRDFWFSYSNALAVLADNLKIDALKVIDAVNFEYSRTNVALPSPGVGGPCLSKDPYILLESLDGSLPAVEDLIMSARNMNNFVLQNFVDSLVAIIGDSEIEIHVLGIAFKGYPETDDLRDSTSLSAIAQLKSMGQQFKIWDPVVDNEKLQEFGEVICDDKIGVNAGGILILNNHRSFSQLNWSEIAKRMKRSVIFDGWNILNEAQAEAFSIVKTLGKF